MCALTVHGPWSMSKSSEESSFDAHNIGIVAVTEKRLNVSSPAATRKGKQDGPLPCSQHIQYICCGSIFSFA